MRLRKVSSKYGSPMGRHSDTSLFGKLHLSRVVINCGGYDRGGAYWGLGAPLYCAQDNDGHEMFFRATNRITAKAYLREMFGDDITFYR